MTECSHASVTLQLDHQQIMERVQQIPKSLQPIQESVQRTGKPPTNNEVHQPQVCNQSGKVSNERSLQRTNRSVQPSPESVQPIQESVQRTRKPQTNQSKCPTNEEVSNQPRRASNQSNKASNQQASLQRNNQINKLFNKIVVVFLQNMFYNTVAVDNDNRYQLSR